VIGSSLENGIYENGTIGRSHRHDQIPTSAGQSSSQHEPEFLATGLACLAVAAVAAAADEPKIDVQAGPDPRESRPALSFAPIVKKVSSSVVTIYSTKKIKRTPENPLLTDPSLRRFFGLEVKTTIPPPAVRTFTRAESLARRHRQRMATS